MGRWVEDDEDTGDDLDELLEGSFDDSPEEFTGAAKKRGGGGSKGGGRAYYLMAGLPVTAIPAGSTGTAVHVDLNESMAPRRFVLGTAAQALRVVNMVIGTKNMNINGQPIPGNAFSQDSVVSEIRGYMARGGIGIDLSLANPSGAPIDATGGFFGPTAIGG